MLKPLRTVPSAAPMPIAIHAEQLGKSYTLYHQRERSRYLALRDLVTERTQRIWRTTLDMIRGRPGALSGRSEEFWALRDLSFSVQQGEAVGIIGRNGAGKSTLLKILGRITEPSSGRVTIRGRVASLLEVGTGFHPELTGRENVFLNGSVLGMSRAEIRRKFDEIVAFADVERFLDTPVKRYSSGMYMRLAFAVAAHLEPEILLVDEVLAVGDAEFQKRCLGKMNDVVGEGRTVLFVSHNMAAIHQFCSRGLVLDRGQIVFAGTVEQATRFYTSHVQLLASNDLSERKDRQGSQWLRFTRVDILDAEGQLLQQVLSGQDIRLRFYYEAQQARSHVAVNVAFNVRNSQGMLLTNLNSTDVGEEDQTIYRSGYFECHWPRFNLRADSYSCALFCAINGETVDWIQHAAFVITVEDGNFHGTGKLIDRSQGDLLVDYTWSGGAA